MSNDHPESASRAPEPFTELLARQAQLRAWIEQLDAADDVPQHVTDRVRADYESRLAALVEQLRSHESAIRADAERLEDALHRASEERQAGEDALAEGRLRHRLGEWSAEEWATRRAELDGAVSAATSREEELRAEMERLQALLFEIGGEAADEDTVAGEDTVADEDTVPDEDLGFLRGIDEALTAEEGTLSFGRDTEVEAGTLSMDAAPPVGGTLPMGPPPIGADPKTRPKSGVKCPECGYTNDATAWYCGVCGVSLT